MILANNRHVSLITDELVYQTNEFEKLLKKQAARMFVDNELYLCRFQGYDEARGNLIVKFDHKVCYAPRKNENLHCFVSALQDENVKKWGGLTYQDLRRKVTAQFECKTVFFTYNKDHTIVGLSGVKIEDIDKYEKNALIFLAPTDPPLVYLQNLENYLLQEGNKPNKILDLNISNPNWNPQPLLVDDEIVTNIQTDFLENDIIIIQGPPGTGKTFLMAQLCAAFVRADFRVLVTALTNRALIELAEKEHLKPALEQGKVYKTALSADESKNKKVNGLQSFRSISQQQPQMLLSTYYIMSQIATKAVEDEHFDYIIIEEASQALLSTIALARKVGKKCIIIGDTQQLEPIFHKDYAHEDTNGYHWMICGLKALSYYLPNAKQYILMDSYRLCKNALQATNNFYGGVLKSKSKEVFPLNFKDFPVLQEAFNINGGTSLKKFNLPSGRIPSSECFKYIIKLIDQLKVFNKKSEIAILAFNRDSVRSLQKEIYVKCKDTNKVLVETIDKIQGLTTDFTILFIPSESAPFALHLNRFNVATSRARFCTLIISDETITSFYTHIDERVRDYLNSIKGISTAKVTTIEPKPKQQGDESKVKLKGLTVVDRIDLSKFEKPKKEIKKDKENIYIIDTNVFVDQPDIISKIDMKYSIVLSAKVIDELDYLKVSLTADQQRNVQKALRLINNSIDKRDLRMELSDLSLLPKDFNTRSADNKILTVALKYKSENPIILTSDNGLQIKSKGLKLTTISLKEFLAQQKRR